MSEWIHSPLRQPEKPGWYPTLYCWEVGEGFCTGAHYWDGVQWTKDGDKWSVPMVTYLDQPQEDKDKATYLSKENDPDW